eukprot:2749287-Amphidinium_carterae.1
MTLPSPTVGGTHLRGYSGSRKVTARLYFEQCHRMEGRSSSQQAIAQNSIRAHNPSPHSN